MLSLSFSILIRTGRKQEVSLIQEKSTETSRNLCLFPDADILLDRQARASAQAEAAPKCDR